MAQLLPAIFLLVFYHAGRPGKRYGSISFGNAYWLRYIR